MLDTDMAFQLSKGDVRQLAKDRNIDVTEDELDKACEDLPETVFENGFWDIVEFTLRCVKE